MGSTEGGRLSITLPRGNDCGRASEMNELFKAVGLHDAMYLIPIAFFSPCWRCAGRRVASSEIVLAWPWAVGFS